MVAVAYELNGRMPRVKPRKLAQKPSRAAGDDLNGFIKGIGELKATFNGLVAISNDLGGTFPVTAFIGT